MRKIERLLDIRTCDLRISEVMAWIEDWKMNNPGREIWLDGDEYAICTWGVEA